MIEKLIDFFGKFFFRFIKKREKFFISLQKNNSKLIFTLLLFLFPFALILAYSSASSLKSRIWIFSGYMLISFLSILIAAFYFRGKQYYDRYKHGLEMVTINLYSKQYQTLLFTKEDIDNLTLLSAGLNVESKINNRNMIKNGKAANFSFIFSIMHRLVVGGIIDIDTKRRKILFEIIENSFLMNSQNVNADTLPSSFSRWNSDMKRSDIVVQEHQKVIKVLGIQ